MTPVIQVTVHSGPGKFTVTAGMVASMQNNHTAQVLLLNPVELEMPEGLAEWITGNVIQVCGNAGKNFETILLLLFSSGSGCNLWI